MTLERLEPCAGKLARTVLRRVVAGNGHYLSDAVGLQTPLSEGVESADEGLEQTEVAPVEAEAQP